MRTHVVPQRLVRRHLKIGVLVSAALHFGFVVTAIAATVIPFLMDVWSLPGTRIIEVRYAPQAQQAAQEKAAIEEPAKEPEPPPVHVVSDPAEVTGQMVRERIDKLADEAKSRSLDENLGRLANLSERLSQVSSAPSVDAMAGAMHSMLGTKPRATEPAAAKSDAVFDYDTAQFHDVKRLAGPNGGWRYVAVLIDHAGVTCETELDQDTGERLYRVMERIKANPLLAQVYRQIAMPLIDQMLGGARRAAEAGSAIERAAKQASEKPPPAPPEPENPFDDNAAAKP